MGYRTMNKGLRYWVATVWILASTMPSMGQFEAQTSQYMFHLPAYNPAAIAENEMINVSGQFRQQWLGWPGAPQTLYFTINAPFRSGKTSSNGIGIKFLRDALGAFVNQAGHIQYAHKRTLGKGRLSIGADVGWGAVSFIADSTRSEVNSEFHNFLGDTAIPTSDDTDMAFDVSLGAFYSAPKYYLGVSYVHLNAPHFKLNNERTQFKVRGVLYVTTGYDIPLQQSRWTLRSSSLIKSDFVSWQAEISSRLEYKEMFWGGLGYRYQDAVAVFAGISLQNGLQIGFSYDVPASKVIRATWGTPEILLSYSFMFDKKDNSSYKSIRIL